jgi:hypothetical protein
VTAGAPRFAAIIGHADDVTLLAQCIRHHLSIGIDRLFVSVNDEAAALPAALDGDERVRAVRSSSFAHADTFRYFSHALREVIARIAETGGLADSDLLIVDRYNSFPQLLRDGQIAAPDLDDPFAQLLVLARESIEANYLAGDYRVPWIMGADAPKVLVRPGLVQQVGAGGHSIHTAATGVRWKIPDDLAILHAPFTTEARFLRKVEAIRTVMQCHGSRFDARQAWHWRYWATLGGEQLAAEFRRQCIRASAVPVLRQQAVIGDAAALYPQLRQQAQACEGEALSEILRRVISSA